MKDFFSILCVDDEPDIRQVLKTTFEVAGFDVRTAASGEEALELVGRTGLPDLAVIDIRMPGLDGLELARRLHGFSDLPIVFLTAVDDEATVVEAIQRHAEDYLVKPFRPAELSARVGRILRRARPQPRTESHLTPVAPGLAVDFVSQRAQIGSRQVTLTAMENKILHVLAQNAGRTVRTSYLLERLWPLDEVFEDTLRVHIHRLRRKLESDPGHPRWLVTDRGHGYRLASPG